jgi:rhodanese-related sulfurtransferase
MEFAGEGLRRTSTPSIPCCSSEKSSFIVESPRLFWPSSQQQSRVLAGSSAMADDARAQATFGEPHLQQGVSRADPTLPAQCRGSERGLNMQTIDRAELSRWMDEGRDFALVEVLSPEAYRRFHLPNAINVPVDQKRFEAAIERAVPAKNRPVVVYCQDKTCDASPKAAKRMEQSGYAQVYDYEAGKADWKDAGLPVQEGWPQA